MQTSTGSSTFFGRERELTELSTALDSTFESHGGLTMLVGEPGIGKTRLTEELVILANERGVPTAWGTCYEGGTTPPYWPWIQATTERMKS
jgi:predicted ATPase